MIISFSVGNYRSFRHPQTLSMQPASITDYPGNVLEKGKHEALSTAVVYGANSSGKSNLVSAMNTMKRIVMEGFERRSVSEIPYDPFLLHPQGPATPTHFEVIFWVNEIKYRYGFEADKRSIQAEWLFYTEKKAEKPLFLRIQDGIEVMRHFPEGKDLEEKTRDNVLFLAVVDQFNGKIASSIMNWFRQFNVVSGLSHNNYRSVTFKMLEDAKLNHILTDFYRDAGLGFEKIKVEKRDFDADELPPDLPESLIKQIVSDLDGKKMVSLKSVHKVYDDENEPVAEIEFDVRRQESSGTNKLIDLSGPIFNTLMTGGVLVVDELDAKLHPLLTLSIVKLFQNQKINFNGAQLVFAVHDSKILSLCDLRRDQIYFIEKEITGASRLYSLVEYGNVRKDRSFEKDYISGRYGAIPIIEPFDKILEQWQEK